MPKEINYINTESEEADATDTLLACRGNLCSNNEMWKQLCAEHLTPPHQHRHTLQPPSETPTPPPARTLHVFLSAGPDKPLCLLGELQHPEGSCVWIMATGWPDTQWQTRPWADRTNAITPRSAHSTAAQNTAISYLSRQLCLRRCIQRRKLAFYHTSASLGTERSDKHITVTEATLAWKFHIVFCSNTQGPPTTLMLVTRYQTHSPMSSICQKELYFEG